MFPEIAAAFLYCNSIKMARINWFGSRSVDIGPTYVNKDHQRMMVDPMFMIVQSLRSFLTAVTPTAVIPNAVAPIAVI